MLEPLANGRSVTHYMATLCENKEEAPTPTPALPPSRRRAPLQRGLLQAQLFAEAAHAQAAVGAKRSRTCRDAAEVLQRSQRLAPAGDAPPHRPPCAWPLLGARAPGGVLARGSPPRRRQLLVPGQGLRPAAARRSHGETIHPGGHISRRCMPCHAARGTECDVVVSGAGPVGRPPTTALLASPRSLQAQVGPHRHLDTGRFHACLLALPGDEAPQLAYFDDALHHFGTACYSDEAHFL